MSNANDRLRHAKGDTNLSDTARNVAGLLLVQFNKTGADSAEVDAQKMAKSMGRTNQQVTNALLELAAKGYLDVVTD